MKLTLPKRLSAVSLQWQRSLKTRVTLLMLAIFVVSLWTLAAYSSATLRQDMQHQLGQQQRSAASNVATQIDTDLNKRLRVLSAVAARITPAMLGNTAALQTYLDERLIIKEEFNAGAVVLGSDAVVIADSIMPSGRLGRNDGHLPHIAAALREGRASVGTPHQANTRSTSHTQAEFGIAVPIRDAHGQVIGALTGITDLGRPNFLDMIRNRRYGQSGGFLLVAPQHRLVVTASDPDRIMSTLPGPGVDALTDRFIAGFEGPALTVNALGVEVLASAKGIAAAGWYVLVSMPTTEAFAPIRALQQRMLQAALLLSLVAGALVWWMLRRQLAPMQASALALTRQVDAGEAVQALPITRADEIGTLIAGFNHLLEALGQRESSLHQSERRFRRVFEGNSCVMLMIAPASGAIIDANQAAAAFYGYAIAQLTGMSINQINTLSSQRVAEERQCALREERNYFNFQHRLASGVVRDVEVYSTPIEIDRQTLLFSIIHDISERKALQQTLQQSELRYRTIADFTADWEYWLLPDATLRYMSPSCVQISGYSAAQFYAEPQLLTSIVHPDDALLFDGHRHHLSGQGVPLPIDFRILTQDGETRWVSHVCQPVFDPAGQPLGLRGSNRDVTARKEVEAALARSHADLQRFAEVTAHHLQEPARRIANYAERLGKQLAGRIDDAEAQLSLDFIGQQARRQQNLLRDVERYLAADQPRGKLDWVNVQLIVSALLAR